MHHGEPEGNRTYGIYGRINKALLNEGYTIVLRVSDFEGQCAL